MYFARIVRPNLDSPVHQQLAAAVMKVVSDVVDSVADLAVAWEEVPVVVAVKSTSPTFVLPLPTPYDLLRLWY